MLDQIALKQPAALKQHKDSFRPLTDTDRGRRKAKQNKGQKQASKQGEIKNHSFRPLQRIEHQVSSPLECFPNPKLPPHITLPQMTSNHKSINLSNSFKAFNLQYMLKLHLIKVIAQFKSLSARFNSKSQSYAQPIPSINIYAIRHVIEH